MGGQFVRQPTGLRVQGALQDSSDVTEPNFQRGPADGFRGRPDLILGLEVFLVDLDLDGQVVGHVDLVVVRGVDLDVDLVAVANQVWPLSQFFSVSFL